MKFTYQNQALPVGGWSSDESESENGALSADPQLPLTAAVLLVIVGEVLEMVVVAVLLVEVSVADSETMIRLLPAPKALQSHRPHLFGGERTAFAVTGGDRVEHHHHLRHHLRPRRVSPLRSRADGVESWSGGAEPMRSKGVGGDGGGGGDGGDGDARHRHGKRGLGGEHLLLPHLLLSLLHVCERMRWSGGGGGGGGGDATDDGRHRPPRADPGGDGGVLVVAAAVAAENAVVHFRWW